MTVHPHGDRRGTGLSTEMLGRESASRGSTKVYDETRIMSRTVRPESTRRHRRRRPAAHARDSHDDLLDAELAIAQTHKG